MRTRPSIHEWMMTARSIYRLKGFPRDEFTKYYDKGMSPLDAMESATRRRVKRHQYVQERK